MKYTVALTANLYVEVEAEDSDAALTAGQSVLSEVRYVTDGEHGPYEPDEEDGSYPTDWTLIVHEHPITVTLNEEDNDTATCPLDGEEYSRSWDLDHERHDSDHPNHHKFCAIIGRDHYHDDTFIVWAAP
jgi:hypothetical protein